MKCFAFIALLLVLLVACESELPPSPPPPGGEVMAGRAGFNIPGTIPSWAQPASGAVGINKDTFYLGDNVVISVDLSGFSGRTAVWGTLYRLKGGSWKSVKAEKPRSLDKGWSLADETEWEFGADEVGMKYALVYICLGEPWQCGGKYQIIAFKVEQKPATPAPQQTVRPTATPVATATPTPVGTPVQTPPPRASPSPTPIATATPTPSSVSTPSPTPTTAPYIWISLGSCTWTGVQGYTACPSGTTLCASGVSSGTPCQVNQVGSRCSVNIGISALVTPYYQCVATATPDEFVWNQILEFPAGSQVCSDSVSANAPCTSSQENVKCKKLAPATGYQCIKKPAPTPSATPTPTPIVYTYTLHKTDNCGSAYQCYQQGFAECALMPVVGSNCQYGSFAKCYYCKTAGACTLCQQEKSYLECQAECALVCNLYECAI